MSKYFTSLIKYLQGKYLDFKRNRDNKKKRKQYNDWLRKSKLDVWQSAEEWVEKAREAVK